MGVPLAERAPINMTTNYYGTMNVTRAFLPLMKPSGRYLLSSIPVVHILSIALLARVVIMGSESADMLNFVTPDLQLKFTSPELTIEELSQLMDAYVE